MNKLKFGLFAALLALSSPANAEETVAFSDATLGISISLPGAKWSVNRRGAQVSAWSSDGLSGFVMVSRLTRKQTALKQALNAQLSKSKRLFSFISTSNDVTCGARNGFGQFCFQRVRGFIESSGWSSQGDMIIFATKVRGKLISGAFFSATPIHARHYVDFMVSSMRPR